MFVCKEKMMRRIVKLAALLVSVSIPSLVSAETLTEALTMAYGSNPDLAAGRASLRAQDENRAIAQSGFRPNASATLGVNRSETDPSNGGSFGSTNQSYDASLNQPLFRGYRTTNNVKSADSNIFAGRQQLRGTEQTVMIDGVTAYMNVIRDEAILRLNQNQVEVLRQQLKATKDRFRVGELTRTDTAQAEARLALADSGRIAAEGTLSNSREAYRRVMGQLPGSLVEPVFPDIPATVDEASDIAARENPRLLAAQFVQKAAGFDVKSAQGSVLPSADATVGVSRSDRSNLGNQVFGSSASNSANIGTRVTIPLYQSGSEYARVRQAKQLASQRQLEISIAARQVEQQVRTAWSQLQTTRANIVAQLAAVSANAVALEGVRQELTVGSRTTLDVLNAQQEYLNAQVLLVQAKRDASVASYALLASIGRLDAPSLKLPVDAYDPTRHYENVKDKWFGWDTDQ
jgi:outer membrane protein